jgi:poly(A) polymerase
VRALDALLREPKLARLLAALAATGCETRIVGGAVRDALLGIAPQEVDLATPAHPEAVMIAAERAGFKVAPIGLDHGTVTIVVDGEPFEVTTLREDVETYGRAAKVRFGADFKRDALRRDFTVNALSLTPDGVLHDYAGGREDLAARRIRFIGDPAKRIREDYLRILRFFRFHAAIGQGPIDRDGLHAAILAREKLVILSRERVGAELMKLLAARGAPATVRIMCETGILEALLGLGFPARLERLAAIEAERKAPPDPVLRLAALAVLVQEDAERVRVSLRLSNGEHARLSRMARLCEQRHGFEAPFTRQELLELVFHEGRRGAFDAIALLQAESGAGAEDARWREAFDFVEASEAPVFPLKAADLMRRGVAPGRELGAILKRLQADWIRSGFPSDPRKLVELIEKATGQGQQGQSR